MQRLQVYMTIFKRASTIFSMVVLLVACDQGSKLLVSKYLPKDHMVSYFDDILRVGYTENTGVFLGLGNNLPEKARFWFFIIATGVFLFGLLIYLLINIRQQFLSLMSLSLIFAGGVGNLYDRVTNNGAVIDFLNVGLGSIRTGIFNIADMAIMLGVIMFVLTQNKKQCD